MGYKELLFVAYISLFVFKKKRLNSCVFMAIEVMGMHYTHCNIPKVSQ